MIPNDKGLDRKDDSEQPLENQQIDSLEEDRELEHRKPHFGRDRRGEPGNGATMVAQARTGSL